jgi:hypothetical protein
MTDNNKTGGIIILGICAALIIYGIYEANRLSVDHKLVNDGLICECHGGGRGNGGTLFVEYNFSLNGRKIHGSASYVTSQLAVTDCREYFVGHYFPVLYECNNLSNNIILVTPEVFEKYNIGFPDSLKWVNKYLR